MIFTFSGKEKCKCRECILTPFTKGKGEELKIESIEFKSFSAKKLEHVVNNGIDSKFSKMQEIAIEEIKCEKEEYEKLKQGRNYSVIMTALTDVGKEDVKVAEIHLGNIDLRFDDVLDVEKNLNHVIIKQVNMTLYPFGLYKFNILE